MRKRVLICQMCTGPGAALAEAMRSLLAAGWDVEMQDCLSVCDAPVAVAVQKDGAATYLFAGLDDADAADLAALTVLVDDAPDGWITDARAAGRARHCLRGRIPAL